MAYLNSKIHCGRVHFTSLYLSLQDSSTVRERLITNYASLLLSSTLIMHTTMPYPLHPLSAYPLIVLTVFVLIYPFFVYAICDC